MKFFLIMIALILLGCSSKGTSTEGKYGHWIFRGSSTFPQMFQCVDKLEPHQDKEC